MILVSEEAFTRLPRPYWQRAHRMAVGVPVGRPGSLVIRPELRRSPSPTTGCKEAQHVTRARRIVHLSGSIRPSTRPSVSSHFPPGVPGSRASVGRENNRRSLAGEALDITQAAEALVAGPGSAKVPLSDGPASRRSRPVSPVTSGTAPSTPPTRTAGYLSPNEVGRPVGIARRRDPDHCLRGHGPRRYVMVPRLRIDVLRGHPFGSCSPPGTAAATPLRGLNKVVSERR